jgi:ParB/RepB/Spo0J family partition protein
VSKPIGTQYERRMVPIDAIAVGNGYQRRAVNEAKVAELAGSILEIGLLNPITVDQDAHLIAGAHRLAALRLLEWTQVPVCVVSVHNDGDRLRAQLACIDENLSRSDLTELERGEALAERKRLYLELHPETAQGGDRRSEDAVSNGHDDRLVPTFAADTAAKTGTSDRTIRRAVQIGTDLAPEARDAVRNTPTADNQQDLLRLSRMAPEQQVPVAQKIATGQAKSVGDAQKQIKREAAMEIATTATLPELVTLHLGNFQDVLATLPDESVDLIFTDPPYSDDTAPLFEDLAAHASRLLKPGGSLITYVGQNSLREVMNYMNGYLRYWWILCAHHRGGAARLAGKYVIVEWKPLLWYVRDRRRADADYLVDFVEFGREPGGIQELHDWQQQEAPARFAIEKLTQPGDVVLDPFLGSGTTLAAAVKLGRRGIGVEADADRLAVAKTRLSECRGEDL